jgi:hypothetical protein
MKKQRSNEMKNEMKEKRYRIILNSGHPDQCNDGGDYYERIIFTPVDGGWLREYRSSWGGEYCPGCGRYGCYCCESEIVQSLPEGGEWIE